MIFLEGSLWRRQSKKLPIFLQTEISECGLACLAMVASYYGHNIDLATLRRLHPVSARGASLAYLIDIAANMGLAARPFRLELEALPQLPVPAILHWDMRHFVVLKRCTSSKAVIHDPAVGLRTLPLSEVSRSFTGVALELVPTASFQRVTRVETLRLSDILASLRGGPGALVRVFGLSLILLLLALLTPLFLQTVVDEVVFSHDADLLLLLAAGFAIVEMARAVTQLLRAWLVTYFGSSLIYQLGSNLFYKLLRLKMDFFQKRHLGDIVSRFQSINSIRLAVTENLVAALIDGTLTSITVILMLALAWPLALVVGIFLVIQTIIRFIAVGVARARQEEEIVASARESSNFMETIRAIQGIKVYGREGERHAVWLNHFAARIAAGSRAQFMRAVIDVTTVFTSGLETIVIVYLGARAMIAGDLTTGSLLAFLGYKGQFSVASTRLADKLAELVLLQLHLGRLADIALGEAEATSSLPPQRESISANATQSGARLEARGLTYRYSKSDPYVVKAIELCVEAGGSLVIFGPSGCGKSTLLKLLAGLYEASDGTVLIDEVDRAQAGMPLFRRQIAAVLHDDHLLSGTIADNIAFFEPEIDLDWVQECAKLAHVHDDISRLPMGYETLIGDLGASLSAGQQQRILLARAFYRRPRLLFLDEATSNLDVHLEAAVCESIRRLAITRIFVAHRPEAIQSADRFAYMENGSLKMVNRDEMLALLQQRPGC